MEIIRYSRIAEFQRQAGLEPATGRCAELIEQMKQKAVLLLEILVLEKTGIRDGDGRWTGTDVMEHCVCGFEELYREYQDAMERSKQWREYTDSFR